MSVKKVVVAFRNALIKVTVFWVLLVATYLALGRQFFPQISQLQPQLEQWLSSQLMQPVVIGELSGEWARFDPVIKINDLRIGDELTVASMVLVPGVLESIGHGGLSFTRFEVQDFKGRLWQADGRWQLAGLKTQEGSQSSAFTAEALLALLQRQQSVQLTHTHLTIEPELYPAFDLLLESGELANYNTENSLSASARVEYLGVTMPISLQVEFFQQRPQDNRLYFSHGEFDFSPWLTSRFPLLQTLKAQGEYWVDLTGTQWRNISARQHFHSLVLRGAGQPMLIDNLKAEWFANAQQPLAIKAEIYEYELNGARYPGSKALLTERGAAQHIVIDRAPVEGISAWLAVNDGSGLWAGLAPTGLVNDVSIVLHPNYPAALTASLTDVKIDEFQGVPALDNLKAEVRIEGGRGRMVLQPTNTSIGLPYLYPEPFTADIRAGEFNWHMTPLGGVQLSAEVATELMGPSNVETLPVQVRWQQRGTSQAERALGIENFMGVNVTVDAPINRDWLLPFMTAKPIPQYITELLDQQLLSVQLPRTSLSYVAAGQQDWLQLSAEFEQLNYRFLEEWPHVLDAQGQLQLTGSGLHIEVNRAYYDGIWLDSPQLSIDFAKSELALKLQQNLNSEVVLALLTRPPLRNWTGSQLDTWAMPNTQADITLNLSVPLTGEPDVFVGLVADVESADLMINNFDLTLNDLFARVYFDTLEGLSINNARFQHDGLPQRGRVQLPMSGEVIQLTVEGSSRPAFWGDYFNDPALRLLNETVSHATDITIADDVTRIHVTSDLVGAAFDLPEPLQKTQEQPWPLDLTVELLSDGQKNVSFLLNQQLQGQVVLNERNAFETGWVGLGDVVPREEVDGLYVDARGAAFNGDHWWQWLQRARALYSDDASEFIEVSEHDEQPNATSTNSLMQSFKQVTIVADEITYLGQPWQQADVTIARLETAWEVDFAAQEAAGKAIIDDATEVIDVGLDFLTINRESEPETSVLAEGPLPPAIDPLAGYLPADVPNLDVRIDQLSYNEQTLGSWQFKVRIDEQTLRVTELQGALPAAQLAGELIWRQLPGSQQTETLFIGDVQIANVLDLLKEWGYPPVLMSRSGRFDVDFTWRGSPAFFDIKRVRGGVQLEVNQGAILQVEAYEGVKLIGLLNFSRLFQRLALDFSDLMGTGISFDKMSGEFLFDRGYARVGEPLFIDGPATKFRFNGDADLHADNIDLDMLLTIPLSSTFPLVALLAGVSPQAAAAIFVTERVFNNQLERLSSVRMSITGSFANPEMRFYRLDDSLP